MDQPFPDGAGDRRLCLGLKILEPPMKLDVDDDHNIDGKITGIGAMMLKSEFVKKV